MVEVTRVGRMVESELASKKNLVAVQGFQVGFREIARIDQVEFWFEKTEVVAFQLFNEVKAIHLKEGLLGVDANMVKLRVEDQSIQQASSRVSVVCRVVLG